ncbi:MFS general substrate transporter [Lentithecium fluviatile CBS 122367]|uniref:MFS general substrate transporter n=1 Tax=Lentithecium fluviatile CBS 122367 TaxID=1168545 RepID=A0A6G1IYN4_9PLEO|nr:MFS general substrate transporter [Lentithecium fluviatile CBS 122367]
MVARVEEVYNVFSKKERWMSVIIVGIAGVFPALTFNFFLPAMGKIATDFSVSLEAIHLTITAYLIVQGVTPIITGPLADSLGRRSVYIYSFLLYVISSVVLSFSPNYPVLLVFRGLQAAGVASTVSIGCAVIQDLTPMCQRDSFYSFYQGIRNVTLVLAPVCGGLNSNWANFRCLFVILFGAALSTLAAILLFLPETLRSIAGNGTVPLTGIHQPWIWRCGIFGKPAHMHLDEMAVPRQRPKVDYNKFTEPFHLLRETDIILSLAFSSVIYAIWMMVTVSTTGLFQATFGLKEALIGLVFVPNALGTIAGSTLIGNLLTQDFLTACSIYQKTHSLPPTVVISRHSLPADFPLEHTRLIRLPGLVVIFTIALSFYGFTLSYPSLTTLGGWIAIPLLLQFLMSAMAHAICGVHQTLITDLWPSNGAAAATISNLVKCLLAGVGVAVVQKMLESVLIGPTFLALGLVVLVLVPLPIVQWYWGCGWRQVRDAKRSHSTAPHQSEKT